MTKAGTLQVIFDLGGVLIDWNPRYLYRQLFADDEAGMERFLAEICSPAWNLSAGRRAAARRGRGRAGPTPSARAGADRGLSRRWLEMVAGPIAPTVALLEAAGRSAACRLWALDQLVGRDLRPGPPRPGLRLPRPVPPRSSSRASCAWSSRTRRSSATCWTAIGAAAGELPVHRRCRAQRRRGRRAWACSAHRFTDARRARRGAGAPRPARRRASWSPMRRGLVRIGLGLLARSCVLAGWRRGLARSGVAAAARRATVAVPGLAQPVAIVRDAHAIPHVAAASEADAYLAMGFLHGQDRLWQMEFDRLVGQGRLAEVAGRGGAARSTATCALLGLAQRAEAALAPAAAGGRWPCSRPTPRASMPRSPATALALPPEFLLLRHRPGALAAGRQPAVPEADGARPVAATGARSCCARAWRSA